MGTKIHRTGRLKGTFCLVWPDHKDIKIRHEGFLYESKCTVPEGSRGIHT